MKIDFSEYRKKVMGCWLGKAVGGTLGGPVEGICKPMSLTFYDPVPEEMMPNDDLDLQVVWLETLLRKGLPVNRKTLSEAWIEHIHMYWDEYGASIRNISQGIYPSASGYFDNGFTAGMGAAIRTEIWACLAPGDPALAVRLATEDACVDHAEEGVYATLFIAAIESAAFVESNRDKLIETGLSFIPSSCRVAKAVKDTIKWWHRKKNLHKVREILIEKHANQNWTDVAINMAFIILGWYAGGNDFNEILCSTVNCGHDADCTAATIGSILGIINPSSIGEKWLKPIGRDLILSPNIVGMHHRKNLDEFSEQITRLSCDVLKYYSSETSFGGAGETNYLRTPLNNNYTSITDIENNEALISTSPFPMVLEYPECIALKPEENKEFSVKIQNPFNKNIKIKLHVSVPDGWTLNNLDFNFVLGKSSLKKCYFKVKAPASDTIRAYRNPIDFTIEAAGLKWTVSAGLPMSIPWLCKRTGKVPEKCPGFSRKDKLKIIEAAGHFANIPDGPCVFTTDVKTPFDIIYRIVVQSNRETKIWIDGDLKNLHKGLFRVPALHRSEETQKDIALSRGWHRFTIALGNGKGGQLFTGIGYPGSWKWTENIEYRQPILK
ncbi:MAG: hypothetical protein UT30_C0004G0035 [Candidatus Uhrbacteria bacterium GW2011_GWF2_39_13]|uniref:ADP-ribosylation/Crystallin J1 n=1 Tax=Candidatus Uhrbacteria bacterium GW2011_GWF2_39_13 TaxID=1618995 RepID=A0A0G0QSZ9_9BACT|nr:MAG: hypothetical protein UT30_C0004G0035 [Candidatus Uhrbacteria bacterium GW2011_GWF2_39_13]